MKLSAYAKQHGIS
jgi:putative resolvase